jgi:hypothetical protein
MRFMHRVYARVHPQARNNRLWMPAAAGRGHHPRAEGLRLGHVKKRTSVCACVHTHAPRAHQRVGPVATTISSQEIRERCTVDILENSACTQSAQISTHPHACCVPNRTTAHARGRRQTHTRTRRHARRLLKQVKHAPLRPWSCVAILSHPSLIQSLKMQSATEEGCDEDNEIRRRRWRASRGELLVYLVKLLSVELERRSVLVGRGGL